jgi:hypothetical protein
MLKKFNQFIFEDLRIEELDLENLEVMKNNFLTRLNEYRAFILSSITYNPDTSNWNLVILTPLIYR